MKRATREADQPDVGLEPRDFVGLFTAPRWLRDLGISAWLAVGVTLFVVAAVWVLSLTDTIVTPLITASVVAAVASPLVRALERRGVKRGLGSALLLVLFLVLAIAVAVVVLGGISSQTGQIRSELRSATDTMSGWLTDIGISHDAAAEAKDDVSDAVSSALPALLEGIGHGLSKLSSLVVFLGLTFLSTFFLLKDGPQIRHWAEGHMRVPRRVAHGMGQRVLQSLRGYFVGVTAVAVFNALVVLAGALILGVPLPGSIAVVTFVGAYIPYLGAWTAGIFSVLVALGGAGTDAAVGMIIVQLLANGLLQQLIQPIAYGAALGIHPLAVLLVTIAGGSLFGAVGLILAAPVTAAATRIAADLSRAAEPPEPAATPAPAAGADAPVT
ncbi:MAG TPA: AI-2E family transporter [Gemmatimonadales bacterium]|nr:AI-2E family transporter [Gemmatimonadales bacterium]